LAWVTGYMPGQYTGTLSPILILTGAQHGVTLLMAITSHWSDHHTRVQVILSVSHVSCYY